MDTESVTRAGRTFSVSDPQTNAQGIHVWPFNPDFPIDVVRHRLSGLRPFRMNQHEYFELVYVNSGELVWQVQDRFVSAKKGDLFIMTSPKYHRLTENTSPHASVDSLFFHPDLIQPAAPSCGESEYLSRFFIQNSSFQHVIPASTDLPREIVRLIQRISTFLPTYTDRARVCVKTYVNMIMIELLNYINAYQEAPIRFDNRRQAAEQFKPLFEIIERDYCISPTKAAKIVNMSPSNFRRAFKRLTSQSFVPYLTYFRIEKAQELLGRTDMPIADVGFEVGFCDQSYFGLVFRRLTHITPRQFRQREREKTREPFTALAHASTFNVEESTEDVWPRHRHKALAIAPGFESA